LQNQHSLGKEQHPNSIHKAVDCTQPTPLAPEPRQNHVAMVPMLWGIKCSSVLDLVQTCFLGLFPGWVVSAMLVFWITMVLFWRKENDKLQQHETAAKVVFFGSKQ